MPKRSRQGKEGPDKHRKIEVEKPPAAPTPEKLTPEAYLQKKRALYDAIHVNDLIKAQHILGTVILEDKIQLIVGRVLDEPGVEGIDSGRTAIEAAAGNKQVELVKYLISEIPENPAIRRIESIWNAVLTAIKYNRLAIAKELLHSYPNETRDSSMLQQVVRGKTLLMHIVTSLNIKGLELFFQEYGVEGINARDNRDLTVIDHVRNITTTAIQQVEKEFEVATNQVKRDSIKEAVGSFKKTRDEVIAYLKSQGAVGKEESAVSAATRAPTQNFVGPQFAASSNNNNINNGHKKDDSSTTYVIGL